MLHPTVVRVLGIASVLTLSLGRPAAGQRFGGYGGFSGHAGFGGQGHFFEHAGFFPRPGFFPHGPLFFRAEALLIVASFCGGFAVTPVVVAPYYPYPCCYPYYPPYPYPVRIRCISWVRPLLVVPVGIGCRCCRSQ
jgi:hypothetical protein